MGKVITDEGIVIEAAGDTLKMSGIPADERYHYGLFSIKYTFETGSFPAGTWKEIKNGETSYCLRDRGEGKHKVFIAFAPKKEASPQYAVRYAYDVQISSDNQVTFPA